MLFSPLLIFSFLFIHSVLVGILHIGDEPSHEFSNKLITFPTESCDQPIFESKDFKNTGDKPLLAELTLSTWKDKETPLIVVYTKKFFDIIWKDQRKPRILKMLLNYSTSYCVHIWLDDDLNENFVGQYSSSLLRNDNYFRRISKKDLPDSVDSLIKKILELMKSK